jgi:hypothetical protein
MRGARSSCARPSPDVFLCTLEPKVGWTFSAVNDPPFVGDTFAPGRRRLRLLQGLQEFRRREFPLPSPSTTGRPQGSNIVPRKTCVGNAHNFQVCRGPSSLSFGRPTAVGVGSARLAAPAPNEFFRLPQVSNSRAEAAADHVEQRPGQRAFRVSQGLEDREVISAVDRQQVPGETAFGPRLSVLGRLAA